MNVELLQYPEHPERAVATAARLCYAPVGATELMETMPPERVQSVLSSIYEIGPFFYAGTTVSYTFAVDGVSRALTHQLVAIVWPVSTSNLSATLSSQGMSKW